MKFWVFVSAIIIFSLSAAAQDLETYVPPPLFGNSNTSEPNTRPESAKPIPFPITKSQSERQITIERAADINVPLPRQKPSTAITTAPPSDNGIVTGPKTMPAVKKKSVEAEPTFAPTAPPTSTMLERYQNENKKLYAKSDSSIKEAVPSVEIDPNKSEWAFNLADNQIEPDAKQKLILMNEVIPALDLWGDARVLVYSEAFAQGQSNMNASRRLALNRALEIRKFLTDQAIAPSRIDVRAIKAPVGSATPNILRLKLNK